MGGGWEKSKDEAIEKDRDGREKREGRGQMEDS